jgi:hypothetical protein
MLVHDSLNRAVQVARHWSRHGCPVVLHVDKRVRGTMYDDLVAGFAEDGNIRLSRRHRCEWGTWSLVAAAQSASELMLKEFPEVRHVYLSSGSCLPLRPIDELITYLNERPETDFIESVTSEDVPWTVGGLDIERFTLRFPFAWKRQRFLFDRYVRLQRLVGYKRAMPDGLVPHLGSQWWCLTKSTLSAILNDPRRRRYDRFFKRVWIPDESYFQTLVRRHSKDIESRSLTLSKFDFQGKPHIFYDDHLQLLRRSNCFLARKIWPHADGLYRVFLDPNLDREEREEPNPGKIDRVFSKAVERRTRGRPGLYMQSRFPNEGWENGKTHARYTVLQGYADLFEDFEAWLAKTTTARVHGALFAKDKAYFAGDDPVFRGALSSNARLRDYDPKAFLTNLIWNDRGQHQCFQISPRDVTRIKSFIAKDSNAQVSVISGAWAIPLSRSDADFAEIRKEAARLQKIEARFLKILRANSARARVQISTMAEFIENPVESLQSIIDGIGPTGANRLTEAPRMVNLDGFEDFVQELKNQGMKPYLIGDYPHAKSPKPSHGPLRKPYLVKK